MDGTHISPRMKSNRVSTFCFASVWSCCISTGPTSLYTVFSGVSDANSCETRAGSVSKPGDERTGARAHLLHELVLGQLRVELLARIDGDREVVLDLLELDRRRLEAVLERGGHAGH